MAQNLILLDYGGVLGYDHLIENEVLLGSKMNISPDELNERTSEKSKIGRAFRENQVTEVEFWRAVSMDESITATVAKEFTKMWMDTYSLNKDMMRYIQGLRTQSMKVGVLTNIDVARSKLLEQILDVESNLDYYFPSYKYGYSKDNPNLWQFLRSELRDFDNVVYVDDRTEHIESAERVGWKAIKYSTLSDFMVQFEKLRVSLS